MTWVPLGRRVSLRHRLRTESAAGGRPLLTDVVGTVLAADADTVTLRRANGSPVVVDRADVVALRLLAHGGPPRRLSGEQLQRVTADGWPASVTEPLGDWLLRAAVGFTGRANSVCVGGDPGLPVEQALARVRSFYAGHGLPAKAQVVTGSEREGELTAAGWRPDRPGRVLVLTATVADALAARPPAGAVPVRSDLTASWLRRYGRTEGHDPALVRAVLTGGDAVGFAQLDGAAEPAVAIGRMALTGAWAGMAAVEVDPAHRGQGLARRVVWSLLAWAYARGGRWCWLQTLPDNADALALYASYGFTRHHTYRYLVPAPP